ncbi:MAG: cysteinyl-tRNA synthetase [bacterium]
MVKVFTAQNLVDLPQQVQQMIKEREGARANNDFASSDQLRDAIKQAGYIINDRQDGYELLVVGDKDKKPDNNYLVLFGSGEIAPSSVDIYRSLFLTLGKRDLNIALITTPAGFQPNVEHVYGEIKDFLLASLPDFNLTINIAYANNKELANDKTIVAELDSADIIFAGPGSPTYTVKNLSDTLLYAKVVDKVKAGASLILASAATLAFSKHCLPVYEIYKVGEDLHWIDGLNYYDPGATIIPHFNNREGGVDLDTSNCYIGQGRAQKMLAQLPRDEKVIGIDEHTAYIINLKEDTNEVRGKGSIHEL